MAQTALEVLTCSGSRWTALIPRKSRTFLKHRQASPRSGLVQLFIKQERIPSKLILVEKLGINS
jgi:hypothetical protein